MLNVTRIYFILIFTFNYGAVASMMPNVSEAQLDVSSFAQCLLEKQRPTDLSEIAGRYALNEADLLLPYLSSYAGKKVPGANRLLDKGRYRWTGIWESLEFMLAEALFSRAMTKVQGTLTPATLFEDAVNICGSRDVFCAALISHNVLRTLGRHSTALSTGNFIEKPRDHNPEWFKSNRSFWLMRAPVIQRSLISLRIKSDGENWGDWYHFFGILTFAIHEYAVMGNIEFADFVTRMNRILNPLFASGKEDPVKARIDLDSIEVARRYLYQFNADSRRDCGVRSGYSLGN